MLDRITAPQLNLPAVIPQSKDPTNAERQRRFREKQKQADDADKRRELEAEALRLARQLDQPKTEPEDSFDWEDSAAVIVPEQQAIAIYRGTHGDVIVRQHGGPFDPDDHFIIIHPDNLQAVIDRLCDLAGIGGAP